MNLIQSSALLITGLACLLAGCRSGKVVREDFSKLQRIEIPDAGITFLFPRGIVESEYRSDRRVFALLNPVDEYPDLGQDARYMMKVSFRMNETPPFDPMKLNELLLRTSPEAPWAELDKVIQCESGLFWHLGISVGRYSIDGHEYFEEDIEIARRILESVECIPTAADADGRVEP